MSCFEGAAGTEAGLGAGNAGVEGVAGFGFTAPVGEVGELLSNGLYPRPAV